MTLFGKPADQEDGRLMSQNNHLTGSGCQFLKREGEEMRQYKRPGILKIGQEVYISSFCNDSQVGWVRLSLLELNKDTCLTVRQRGRFP